MPTVIDSLIVEVGLDPSKFTKGQKEAIKSFSDAKDSAKKIGGDIEDVGKRTSEFLSVLQTRLIGVAAVITGGLGIEKLVTQMTKQDAATGRLAYTLNTSTQQLDKWRNAAFLVGGTSEGVTGFITHLNDEYQNFKIHGTSQIIPYLNALGTSFEDSAGHAKPFEQVMREISTRVAKMNPAEARVWLQSIGADEGSINLLIKGTDALDAYLKIAEKFGTLTPQQAENARKLAESYNMLSLAMTEWSRVAINAVTPALIKIQEFMTKAIADRNKNIPKTSLIGRAMTALGLDSETAPAVASSGPRSTAFQSQKDKEAFIRAEAAKRGINPDDAMAVAHSEGFSSFRSMIPGEQSFGAFQLNMGKGAQGDLFKRATGLDPSDPKNEAETIKWALDDIKRTGWQHYHGAANGPHFSNWQGIARGNASTTSNDIRIGTINVYPPSGDADSIAASIGPAIKRNALSYQGQAGPQ